MPNDYQKFFELRKKYPEKCSLIADIMAYTFAHGDTLLNSTGYLFLNKNYLEEDISLILSELNLPLKCIMHCPSRTIGMKAVWYG